MTAQSRYCGLFKATDLECSTTLLLPHPRPQPTFAMSIKVGDKIPEGTFKYVPYTPELENGVSRISSSFRYLRLIYQIPSSPAVSVSDWE